jgi:hypothetical protein
VNKLVSLTISKDYDDYLSATLPSMVRTFDKCYVVTAFDSPDAEVAERCGAEVLFTDCWHDGGSKFNKSGALNFGQMVAHAREPEAWVAIVDADILLSEECRDGLLTRMGDESALVGMRRLEALTPEDYVNKNFYYYPYTFSGYFQMYRRRDVYYHPHSENAGLCDCLFRDAFHTWRLAPGACLHLGHQAVDWEGRKSGRWSTPETAG